MRTIDSKTGREMIKQAKRVAIPHSFRVSEAWASNALPKPYIKIVTAEYPDQLVTMNVFEMPRVLNPRFTSQDDVVMTFKHGERSREAHRYLLIL